MPSTGQAVPAGWLGGRPGPMSADTHVLWVWSQVSHHPIMPLGELEPCALPGQKDILDKGEGFANPEVISGL